jgi:sulfite exporter TauE/SafE
VNSKSYTALGWIVWQIGSRVAKRKLAQNRSKLIAAGVVAAVVVAGIALASNDDE